MQPTQGGLITVRTLTTPQEWLEANRLIATALLEPWAIEVDDAFMPENSGVYRVSYVGGEALVERRDAVPDLRVSVQTLALLVSGRIGLDGALLREGTQLLGNNPLLRSVFRQRPVHLAL